MTILELLKKSNHYTNHRTYTEKAIKDYIEIAQPLRLKYPNVVFKDLINTQFTRNGGRGTEPFDSKEKMIQIERTIIGIIGSKVTDRNIASKTTFVNTINANTTNNPNFSIYNNKIKVENQRIQDEKQKIIDIENNRLIDIENQRIQEEKIELNKRVAKIKETQILKENNDLLREQLFAKQFQEDLESQQNSFIEPVIIENLFKDVIPEIKTDMIIEEKQVSILPIENNNSMYIIAGLGIIAGLIAYKGLK